jgi:hypothetical protein
MFFFIIFLGMVDVVPALPSPNQINSLICFKMIPVKRSYEGSKKFLTTMLLPPLYAVAVAVA